MLKYFLKILNYHFFASIFLKLSISHTMLVSFHDKLQNRKKILIKKISFISYNCSHAPVNNLKHSFEGSFFHILIFRFVHCIRLFMYVYVYMHTIYVWRRKKKILLYMNYEELFFQAWNSKATIEIYLNTFAMFHLEIFT